MKVVNSKAKQIFDISKRVFIKIGTYSGSPNMMVVSLDEFQVIHRMEFMHTIKLVLMSFLNSLCLMGGDDPYVISISRGGTKNS